MSYMEFQPTFEEKVKRETYLENILTCATDLILKDKLADSGILDDLRQKGSASHKETIDVRTCDEFWGSCACVNN